MVATHTRLVTFGALSRLSVILPSTAREMEIRGADSVKVTMLLVTLPKALVIMT